MLDSVTEIIRLVEAEEYERAASMTEDIPLDIRVEAFWAVGKAMEREDMTKFFKYSSYCVKESNKRDTREKKDV